MKFQVSYCDARGKTSNFISADTVLLHKLHTLQDLTCECRFTKVMKELSALAAEMAVVTISIDSTESINMGLLYSSKH